MTIFRAGPGSLYVFGTEDSRMKTTAIVTIVHDPANPEGELSVTCKFEPDVKEGDDHLAGSLAMIAVKAIGDACKRDD